MPDAKPILTFGMPIYNEDHFLEEALESLLAQTRRDWVLHISDNASTDGTEEICRRFAARDARIRYERHEINKGAAFNWTNVLAQAETPLFAWAGGHDRWDPAFVETLVGMLDDPRVILAYPRTRALDTEGVLSSVYNDDHTNTEVSTPSERFIRLVSNLGVTGNMLHGLWRTEVLRSSPLRESFAPDTLLITELGFVGCYVQHPDILFHRRLVREPETCRERVTRAWVDITAKNVAPAWMKAHADFIRLHWDILAEPRYQLSPATQMRLKTQATLILSRRFLVMPWLREELLPRLPPPVAESLRSMWRLPRQPQ